MRYWVGVTDNDWFNYLAANNPEEVNFWQPSGTPPFKNAATGMPFLFKLKKPHNHIGGGGFFVTYSTLPISVAWEVFGTQNGAASFDELLDRLQRLNHKQTGLREIGCTLLASPFFFAKKDWIKDPQGFAANIVRGKHFDTATLEGQFLWDQVRQRLSIQTQAPRPSNDRDNLLTIAEQVQSGWGTSALIKPRLGQSAFRVLVTDAYKRKCAMTGENTLVTLEAAHIVPFAKEQSHDVRNGLLLRADFHKLFDVGLVSVTPESKIKVSPKIREAYFNGKAYYRLDGQPLPNMPDQPENRPDPDRLEWHYKNVFQG